VSGDPIEGGLRLVVEPSASHHLRDIADSLEEVEAELGYPLRFVRLEVAEPDGRTIVFTLSEGAPDAEVASKEGPR
jgi:hypothetical protein